jgi:hypothetical protein
MLVSSRDKCAMEVAISYAKGDFTEAEKQYLFRS